MENNVLNLFEFLSLSISHIHLRFSPSFLFQFPSQEAPAFYPAMESKSQNTVDPPA